MVEVLTLMKPYLSCFAITFALYKIDYFKYNIRYDYLSSCSGFLVRVNFL